MQKAEIKFRVPEGEEITEGRLSALAEIGFSEDDLWSDRQGFVWITYHLPERVGLDDFEVMVEDIAEEIMDAIGDMEMCYFCEVSD